MPSAEQTAARYAARTQLVAAQIVDFIYDNGSMLNHGQLIDLISKLNLNELMLGLGGQANIDSVLKEHLNILQNMQRLAPITGETLQALVEVNRTALLSATANASESLRGYLVQSVLGGKTRAEIKAGLALIPEIKTANVNTIVDTMLRNFGRSVNAVMSEALPQTQKYYYLGALDEKTRDECLNMIMAGELTRDEIDVQFPDAFLNGGGFNCRHSWVAVTSQTKELAGSPSVANTYLNEKKN